MRWFLVGLTHSENATEEAVNLIRSPVLSSVLSHLLEHFVVVHVVRLPSTDRLIVHIFYCVSLACRWLCFKIEHILSDLCKLRYNRYRNRNLSFDKTDPAGSVESLNLSKAVLKINTFFIYSVDE